MLHEMCSPTSEEFDNITKGKECASRHFPALVNLRPDDERTLKQRADQLKGGIAKSMPNLTDSHNRICDNYAMIIAATELVRF